jgi:hypothetical protein
MVSDLKHGAHCAGVGISRTRGGPEPSSLAMKAAFCATNRGAAEHEGRLRLLRDGGCSGGPRSAQLPTFAKRPRCVHDASLVRPNVRAEGPGEGGRLARESENSDSRSPGQGAQPRRVPLERGVGPRGGARRPARRDQGQLGGVGGWPRLPQARRWLWPRRLGQQVTRQWTVTPGAVSGPNMARSCCVGVTNDVVQLTQATAPGAMNGRGTPPRAGSDCHSGWK